MTTSTTTQAAPTPTTATYPMPCCNAPGALVAHVDPARPDITVRTCQTCGRRHREWAVPPIAVGVRLT